MGMLERGGNAFDAAVAAAFSLQIIEPHLNGPGGDAPIMLHDARRGHTKVICGQGPAPSAAKIAYYQDLGLDLVPGTGLLAPCVPYACAPFLLLLRDYGTMSLEEVLAPAIFYAADGHPLLERASATIATVRDLFLADWPTSAALWLDHSWRRRYRARCFEIPLWPRPIGAGFVKPLVARGREAQIERARKSGPKASWPKFHRPLLPHARDHGRRGRAHRGVLTGADIAAWSATIEEPIGYDYGRYRVLKPGPWCQGLVTLQQLALLKGFDLNGLDPGGP